MSSPEPATAIGIGRAEEAVGALRERIEGIVADHPDWQGGTAAVAFRQPGSFGTHSPSDVRPKLLAELGLRMPDELAAIAEDGQAIIELSEERIELVDADVVLWGAYCEMAGVREWPFRRAPDAAPRSCAGDAIARRGDPYAPRHPQPVADATDKGQDVATTSPLDLPGVTHDPHRTRCRSESGRDPAHDGRRVPRLVRAPARREAIRARGRPAGRDAGRT